MVIVTQHTPEQLRYQATIMLPVLLGSWKELPSVLNEIDEWDDGEAMDYIEEWRHLEAQREDIEAAASHGILTSRQLEQLEELRQLVAKYQPQLNHLLGVS